MHRQILESGTSPNERPLRFIPGRLLAVALGWANCLITLGDDTIEGLKELTSNAAPGLYIRALVREPITIAYLNTSIVKTVTTELEASWATNLFAYRAQRRITGHPTNTTTVVLDGRTNFVSQRIANGNENNLSEHSISWIGALLPPFNINNPVVERSLAALMTFRACVNFGLGEVQIGEMS